MSDLRVCFMGDSYMNGTSDPKMLGWVRRLCLARYRTDHRFTYYELGIRGNTSADIHSRWKSECAARLPEGTDNRIVFQFGLNDVAEVLGSGVRVEKEASVKHAHEIISMAKEQYRILWVGFPPVNVPCSPMNPSPGLVINFDQDRAIELNNAYIELAAELQVSYLDILTPLLANDSYMAGLTQSDRMHCDEHGYELMASTVDAWSAWNDWFV